MMVWRRARPLAAERYVAAWRGRPHRPGDVIAEMYQADARRLLVACFATTAGATNRVKR